MNYIHIAGLDVIGQPSNGGLPKLTLNLGHVWVNIATENDGLITYLSSNLSKC